MALCWRCLLSTRWPPSSARLPIVWQPGTTISRDAGPAVCEREDAQRRAVRRDTKAPRVVDDRVLFEADERRQGDGVVSPQWKHVTLKPDQVRLMSGVPPSDQQ